MGFSTQGPLQYRAGGPALGACRVVCTCSWRPTSARLGSAKCEWAVGRPGLHRRCLGEAVTPTATTRVCLGLT